MYKPYSIILYTEDVMPKLVIVMKNWQDKGHFPLLMYIKLYCTIYNNKYMYKICSRQREVAAVSLSKVDQIFHSILTN